MNKVERLSDELANQIAAGEVVERPASVVKELVENALDASASRVTVEIEARRQPARSRRRRRRRHVRGRCDAGARAPRDEQDSRSKLEDLFHARHQFGFRGEALPSIASVSRLTLRTRLREATEATEILVEGGKTKKHGPAGAAAGTAIEVRDLFFNVPARRKFLKATATESAHVGDVVLGMALARPDVTFTLARDGRVVREYLRAPSRVERARAASQGENLAHVRTERGPLRIEAALAAPERARSGATGLALLVNGRPVRDRQLARAVAHAYGSVLESGAAIPSASCGSISRASSSTSTCTRKRRRFASPMRAASSTRSRASSSKSSRRRSSCRTPAGARTRIWGTRARRSSARRRLRTSPTRPAKWSSALRPRARFFLRARRRRRFSCLAANLFLRELAPEGT